MDFKSAEELLMLCEKNHCSISEVMKQREMELGEISAAAAEKKDYARYEKKLYGLECIACGSCTFTCPAKRPLMQLFKQTKAEIMAAKRR